MHNRDTHVVSILISKISHAQLSVFEYMIFVKEIRRGFLKLLTLIICIVYLYMPYLSLLTIWVYKMLPLIYDLCCLLMHSCVETLVK